MKYFILGASLLLLASCGSKNTAQTPNSLHDISSSSQIISDYPSTNTGDVTFDSGASYSENLGSEEIRKSDRP